MNTTDYTDYDDTDSPTVREGVMDMLMPLLRDNTTTIVKTDDGWLIDEKNLILWNATLKSRGSQPPNISFKLTDSVIVDLPNGTQTELSVVEQEFLVSASIIGNADVSKMPRGFQKSVISSRMSSIEDTRISNRV